MSTAIATAPTTAVAQVDDRTVMPLDNLRKLVGSKIDIIRDALPEKMRGAAPRFAISLVSACQANPTLAKCTTLSLFGSLVKAANLGLELGGECWLIPRGGQATFQIGWKGIVTLLYRNPRVSRVSADIVRQGDEFEHVGGTESRITHKYGKTRGEPTHFYCVIKLNGGEAVHRVMSVAEVDAHRVKFSDAGRGAGGNRKGVWAEHFESMALKTVIVLASKTAPKCIELPNDAEMDEIAAVAVDLLPAGASQPRPEEKKAAEGEIVGEGGGKLELTAADLVAAARVIAQKEEREEADIEFEYVSLLGAQSFNDLKPDQMENLFRAMERRAAK